MEKYPAGKAESIGLTPQNYREFGVSPSEFETGVAIEYEHTDKRLIAAQIALDHFAEGLDHPTKWSLGYYRLLLAMEEAAEKVGWQKVLHYIKMSMKE